MPKSKIVNKAPIIVNHPKADFLYYSLLEEGEWRVVKMPMRRKIKDAAEREVLFSSKSEQVAESMCRRYACGELKPSEGSEE